MDCGSVDSELIESLDFLRPPVKRSSENTEQTFSNYYNNNLKHVKILKDFRQTLKKNFISPRINKLAVQSSTSLILKKTSKRKILEQYSIVSYTNLVSPNRNILTIQNNEQNLVHTDKPLVKVTILPKREQVINAKSHKKHRNSSKRIHSTASNQENSIQTRNVYLIVAGRQREKIYEIKATGSAKCFNEQIFDHPKDEEIPIKELRNFKQVIKSLNMERKKKQGKKKAVELSQEGDAAAHICWCSNAVREDTEKNIKSHRSRVRVFGRIGVTEDDKYFVNYDATIDGKPDTPNYTEIQQRLSPVSLPVNNEKICYKNLNMVGCTTGCSKNKVLRNQRDSIIQADVQHYECCQLPNINWMPSKESQSTQVNFNNDLSIKKKSNTCKKYDQIIQCNCSNVVKNFDVSDNESECNSLKESHSPLVIISVYPNQDKTDIIKSVNCCNVENPRHPSPQRVNTNVQNSTNRMNNKKGNVSSNRNANKALRTSRSPSPTARNPSKAKSQETTINKTRVYRTNIRSESPGRQSVKITAKRTTQKDKIKQDSNYKKTACFKDTKREITKNKNMKRNTSPTRETKSTNTEHVLAKKILVDNYTKKVAAQLKKKIANTKNDASRVTINIDGENEFYDVLFNPGKLSTELTVRQTAKEKGSQKCNNQENSASMQNLVPFSNEKQPKMRCCTQVLCNNQPIEDMEINNRTARLNARDSIEISHRREDKVCHTIKNLQTDCSSKDKKTCNDDMEFLAPVKHFTGDNCTIYDPVERDKEIRELLGIKTIRESALQVKKTKEQALEHSNQASVQCFFQNKCDQHIVTEFSLCRLCNCCEKKKTAKKGEGEKNTKNKESGEKSESSNGTDNKNDNNKSSEEQCGQNKCCSKRRNNDMISVPRQEGSEETKEQLIVNRNVQVFLEIEQFTKKKPIILSKKQYEKVKRTIQTTLANKQEKRKSCCPCKCSHVSVGEVREKLKKGRKPGAGAQNDKVNKKHTKKSKRKPAFEEDEGDRVYKTAVVLPDNTGNIANYYKYNVPVRQALSSVEIRYANVAYTKRVTFSTTNIGALSPSSFARKYSNSIQTIFRGHKKSATPNLGTSVFSLLSEGGLHSDTKSVMAAEDSKPRKPFLKRLMSCLVMRTAKESAVKISNPALQEPSANSSIDSYHISTSLGAIEVTSSLYDTSASFYSNHTIQPVNSKVKRGFFSSVRGFLTNRKS